MSMRSWGYCKEMVSLRAQTALGHLGHGQNKPNTSLWGQAPKKKSMSNLGQQTEQYINLSLRTWIWLKPHLRIRRLSSRLGWSIIRAMKEGLWDIWDRLRKLSTWYSRIYYRMSSLIVQRAPKVSIHHKKNKKSLIFDKWLSKNVLKSNYIL